MSDHSSIASSFLIHPFNADGNQWSMPEFLLTDEMSKLALENEIKQFFYLNSDCGVAEETVWDAFKVVLRGQVISLASANKKKIVMEIKSKIKLLK